MVAAAQRADAFVAEISKGLHAVSHSRSCIPWRCVNGCLVLNFCHSFWRHRLHQTEMPNPFEYETGWEWEQNVWDDNGDRIDWRDFF